MKIPLLIFLFVFTTSCAQNVCLYRPLDGENLVEFRHQGLINMYYQKTLLDDVGFSLVGEVTKDGNFGFTLGIGVAKGSKVKLEKAEVIFNSSEFSEALITSIDAFTISVYGKHGSPGYLLNFEPTEILFGKDINESKDGSSFDFYRATLLLKRNAPQMLSIKLPDFKIGDKVVVLPEIEFERIEEKNYGYSLQ